MFIQKRKQGKHKTGVYKVTANRYKSHCRDTLRGNRLYLGSFLDENSAHQAYLSKKEELAYEIASTDLLPQKHVKEALRNHYSKLYNL